jgi:peptidoglycan/LPS O-acetylase OafA/YrhL
MRALETAEKERFHDHVIDLLRGIAALTVFVSHSDQAALLKFQVVTNNKLFLGRYGVYLFFVLSGYLIWRSAQRTLAKPRGLGIYAIHRFTRIAPLYLVNLLFVVYLLEPLGSAFKANVTPEIIIRHLTFTQSLLPSVSRELNPVLWTLTHEAIYYALVPLLFLLRKRIWIVALLAAAFLLLNYAGFRSVISPFLTLFYLFVFGILVAEKDPETIAVGTVGLLALLYLAPPADAVEFAASIAAAATFLVVWPLFAVGTRVPGLLLVTRPLCWAGLISYSLYIWHYLLVNIIGTETNWRAMYAVFGRIWINDYGRAVTFSAVVLLFSALSYFLIELPSMTWLRNWLVGLIAPPRRSAAT